MIAPKSGEARSALGASTLKVAVEAPPKLPSLSCQVPAPKPSS